MQYFIGRFTEYY